MNLEMAIINRSPLKIVCIGGGRMLISFGFATGRQLHIMFSHVGVEECASDEVHFQEAS